MLKTNMISDNFEKLFNEAKKVRDNAHVPYSNFKVGAAFLTEDDSIVSGCNVENAAYPQSQCAEASAIGNLVSQGFSKIKEVVVIGSGSLLCSPCGGCRQRLREFASLETQVHMCNSDGHLKTSTLKELLPDSFGPENL
ncbi:cytidine deaminase [Alphaproteobacteria bacterium]|nr:cytidine deaminase [Alphaproteobacteria bacterium]